jgi:phage terminase small subunit
MSKVKEFTFKQQKFIEAYAGNGVQAAREAGYKGTYATLDTVARANLENPRIAEAIRKRSEKKLRPLIASREDRQRFWSRKMNSAEASLSDRLRASELLGKSEGDFIERREISGPNGGPLVVRKIILPDNSFSAADVVTEIKSDKADE